MLTSRTTFSSTRHARKEKINLFLFSLQQFATTVAKDKLNNNFQNPPAKLSPKSERRNQRAMRRREREATLNHRNSTESLSDDPSQNRRYPHRETPNSNLATPNRDSNLTPNREANSLNKSPNSPNLPNYRVVYLKCRILGSSKVI